VGDGVRVLIHRALTATHPDKQPPDSILHAQGLEIMKNHYAEQKLVKTRLYPGVSETLAYFSNKKKAVVTAKEADFTRDLLEYFGIAEYFDCIIGGDTCPKKKPDPAPLLEALKRMGGIPPEAVMIGDSENDINAGKRAGVIVCGVTYGFRTTEQLLAVSPDLLIDGFEQLRTFFQ
jgi:phosphoglycolate phosphatase